MNDPMNDPRASRRLPDPKECQRLAEQMLAFAKKAGADGAEVLVRDGTELEVKVRLGEPELVKEAGSRALGLELKEVRPGYARMQMNVRDDFLNGHGICHGGLIFTLSLPAA